MDTAVLWNPLTDDGDALRLATKLNLHLGLEVAVSNAWPAGILSMFCSETRSGDPDAATRRAIVRAAAEIGRAEAASNENGQRGSEA
jgi:hypothetical protein